MRKCILIFPLLISPLCFATNFTSINDYGCLHLQISIKNDTPNTCYLLTEELTNNSTMNPQHDLIFKILPHTESPIMDILPFSYARNASIELVYECGDGAYVRLHSEKNACSSNNTIEASILYAANLTATSQTAPASYWSNKPAKVIWTLQ